MPTGYTAKFSDRDVSFREFALTCARGFGACILQRDDDMSVPPKHREVAPYYQDSIDRDTQAIEAFLSLSEAEQQAQLAAVAEQEREDRTKRRRERIALRERYESTLAKVLDWTPPTLEHVNYKAFMVDQLEQSIKFDCGDSDYNDPAKVTVVTPIEHLAKLKSSLDYSIRSRDEEIARCKEANAWIDALYAALPA